MKTKTKSIIKNIAIDILYSLYKAVFYMLALTCIAIAIYVLCNLHTITHPWGAVAMFFVACIAFFIAFFLLFLLGKYDAFFYKLATTPPNPLESRDNELQVLTEAIVFNSRPLADNDKRKLAESLYSLGYHRRVRSDIVNIEEYAEGCCSGYCLACNHEIWARNAAMLRKKRFCEDCGAIFEWSDDD